jgi:hypothetical protein
MSNDVEEMAKLAEQIIAIGYQTLKANAPPGDKHTHFRTNPSVVACSYPDDATKNLRVAVRERFRQLVGGNRRNC